MSKDTMQTFIKMDKKYSLLEKQREVLFLLEPESNDMGLIKVNQKQQWISITCQWRLRV